MPTEPASSTIRTTEDRESAKKHGDPLEHSESDSPVPSQGDLPPATPAPRHPAK